MRDTPGSWVFRLSAQTWQMCLCPSYPVRGKQERSWLSGTSVAKRDNHLGNPGEQHVELEKRRLWTQLLGLSSHWITVKLSVLCHKYGLRTVAPARGSCEDLMRYRWEASIPLAMLRMCGTSSHPRKLPRVRQKNMNLSSWDLCPVGLSWPALTLNLRPGSLHQVCIRKAQPEYELGVQSKLAEKYAGLLHSP